MKIYYIEHAFFKPVSPKHKKQFDWIKEHHQELHEKYGDGYYLIPVSYTHLLLLIMEIKLQTKDF